MNLSNVVTSSNLNAQLFGIIRDAGTGATGGGYFGPGGWVPDANIAAGTVTLVGKGIIVPATAVQIENLPEGDRLTSVISVRTPTPIQQSVEGPPALAADVIVWNGGQYRVVRLLPWATVGFYHALATYTGPSADAAPLPPYTGPSYSLPTGATATITLGTVTTGAPGTAVDITNSGTPSAAVFNFTIPQGEPGTPGTPGTDGLQGTTGLQGVAGTNGINGTAATITVNTTTTLAPGSPATVTNIGTSTAAVLDFGIPQGAAGSGGSGTGTITSVGSLPGLFISTTDASGNVSFAAASAPTLASLNIPSFTAAPITVGDPTHGGVFSVNALTSFFGMSNHDTGINYGISSIPNDPPNGTVALMGFFSGFAIKGLQSKPTDPIFAVARYDQYAGNFPLFNRYEFACDGVHGVRTFNNVLDDGSGNIAVLGSISVGAPAPDITVAYIASGAGAPAAAAQNGSLYLRTDGVAGSTLYVRIAGAWTAIA